MRQILYHDAEGRILRVVASETADPEHYGNAPFLICYQEQMVSGHENMVAGDKLELRPALPELAIAATAPTVIDLSGLPQRTVLRATNAPGDILEITDLTEPLTLTEPGPYTLRLTPPFPWAARSLAITLTTEESEDA